MLRTDVQHYGGVTTTIATEDGALIYGTTQDCTAIADNAKEMHNTGAHGSADLKHAARVPFVFVEKYINDNRITMQELAKSQEHQKRLLGDPAIAHFRIWKGQL